MIQAKHHLRAALANALNTLAHTLSVSPPAAEFESPKQAAHGDLAVTAAMPMARAARSNPRDIANQLVVLLQAQPAFGQWVSALEVAGPGFINLRLKPEALQSIVPSVLLERESFGVVPAPAQAPQVMVEFVSANPTGPLHVGHGRNAALGDSLANLLASQGQRVQREFYYNDSGVQIHTLAVSTQARLRGLAPGAVGWPQDAYNGEYIADIAADYRAGKTVVADDRQHTASGDVDDLQAIAAFAVAYLRHEQDLDLQAFGVRFDHYYLESSLYHDGRVDAAVRRMVASGKTYEKDGALWLRSTDYGDDKDRVMRKSVPAEGPQATPADAAPQYTYFVPDVAYHVAKFERGFYKVINVLGSDHHGSLARVRAGLQAVGLGIPQGYPDVVQYKMITVLKDGQEVKISKRAGSYVTLRDLIDWTSRDAVRFFLASRKADTEFSFDIDLALKANDENPVFYVQYAHARICSVLAQYAQNLGWNAGDADGEARLVREHLARAQLALLAAPTEAALMLKLAAYPDMLGRAAQELAPHDVAFYVRELAAALHAYYAQERFLVNEPELAKARMALLAATAQVLRNALAILGVSAPRSMQRDGVAHA